MKAYYGDADFVEMQCVKAGSGKILVRYRQQLCWALKTKSLENVLKILRISKELCKPNALSSVL